jgi:uncharacterized protein YlxP (DUF503 family)
VACHAAARVARLRWLLQLVRDVSPGRCWKIMPLGCCWIEVHVPGALSLKDKRRVVKSILGRLRSRFNVSASEMDEQDLWQRAVLAVACVSSSKSLISQTFEQVRRSVETQGDVYVTRFETEYL